MASPSLWLPAPTRASAPQQPSRGAAALAKSKNATTTALVSATTPTTAATTTKTNKPSLPPSYEERCRAAHAATKLTPAQRKAHGAPALFVPRSLKDFGDGGSYPEIHVAQYPRHMGNPHLARKGQGGGGAGSSKGGAAGGGGAPQTMAGALTVGSKSNSILSATVDANGKTNYDAIVTGGTNADKKVYSRHSDLRGSQPTQDDVALPTDDEAKSTAERTAAALNSLISAKTTADKPTGSAMVQAATSANHDLKTQYIKYEPKKDAPGYNPSAAQRVIQMVPAQIDPMAPPKHMHRKAPRGPAEDPVPVLHAPPEKLSKEEREAWNVPACISNWKNVRGYTIPLDKRLAADGRGLRDDKTINSNFATLSESLYVAERQAREEVRTRAEVRKRVALVEREKREEELRELANRARRDRSGAAAAPGPGAADAAPVAGAPASGTAGGDETDGPRYAGEGDRGGYDERDARRERRSPSPSTKPSAAAAANVIPPHQSDEDVAKQQRDRLRLERKREREKELRLELAGRQQKEEEMTEEQLAKKRRLEEERDVSEKIALGTHTGAGGGGGEVDARLYGQSAGMDSGFGADDEYNTYSQPLFNRDGVSSSAIYRPSRGESAFDADEQYDKLKSGGITSKFAPDKGFAGAEGGGGGGGSAGSRTAPVQFERGGEK